MATKIRTQTNQLVHHIVASTIYTTGGTVAVATRGVAVIEGTAALPSMILEQGARDGQQVFVINRSTAAVTWAPAATSWVSAGTSGLITPSCGALYVWVADITRWFPVHIGVVATAA